MQQIDKKKVNLRRMKNGKLTARVGDEEKTDEEK